MPTALGDGAPRDKWLVRVIAGAQGLVSLLFFAMTPVLFNYGGATASPGWFQFWLLFGILGIVSAILLVTLSAWARLFAALWEATILVAGIAGILKGPHPAAGDAAVVRALLAMSAPATAYLVITAAVQLTTVIRRSN